MDREVVMVSTYLKTVGCAGVVMGVGAERVNLSDEYEIDPGLARAAINRLILQVQGRGERAVGILERVMDEQYGTVFSIQVARLTPGQWPNQALVVALRSIHRIFNSPKGGTK